MRICRFNENRLGLVEGDTVIDVTAAVEILPTTGWPYPLGDVAMAQLQPLLAKMTELRANGATYAVGEVEFLSPVANPTKVIAAPINYEEHRVEANTDPELHQNTHQTTFDEYANPIAKLGLFLKSSTSVVGPGEGMAVRFPDKRNDHEVELALVIGKEASRVSAADALDYVAGYCIGLDMSVRGTEDRSMRKSPDGYTVMGPWLVTPDEISDPGNLDFWIKVNGETRQQSNTRFLTVPIADLIEIASRWYTLYPGDIILTGTPEGVGPVAAGDTMEAWIQDIGTMTVPVR